ncbi:MAG: 50S ribosomal protein L2 [Candidatus Paceibacterota bacterium]|jgi:large subunit ribosomal protein L2
MKSYNPTTPSRRHMTSVGSHLVSRGKPLKSLTKRVREDSGRNNQGRITTRHQGGGSKKLYRMVDFRQNIMDIPSKVERIEYDPYRNAFIARIIYQNGKRSYILAYSSAKEGDLIVCSQKAPVKDGNRMMLKNIPVGYMVHNIEINPGKGGQVAKSAGSYAEVVANDENYTTLKMPSSERRKVLWDCFASIGQVSNPDYSLMTIGKAGRSRWLGVRPTVRGSAMNPVDHPYGGGEGRQKRGTRKPKTLWGKVTGGRKTRNRKKWSNKLIVSRRIKKNKK